jgi:signal transduction histidine kinase
LQAVDVDIERMTALVGTLLTLARSDAGQLAVERAQFDLADTVRLVLEQYDPMAQKAGIALRDETAPAPLVADEDLLMQLLVNLIDNALAHTRSGGTVVAGCRPDNGRIHLWVSDTGEGIASQHQDRVFDRFYRVDAGRTRERGGAGLGLAICKAITETHGGTIDLTSRLGSGTRVGIVLPDGQPHA